MMETKTVSETLDANSILEREDFIANIDVTATQKPHTK
jgi:hypothetical protein